MSTQALAEELRVPQERSKNRALGIVDFIFDEVQSAVTGKASERQHSKSWQEISKKVWSVSGPLLTLHERAWHDHLNDVASSNDLLRFVERCATERAFSQVREESLRAAAVDSLKPPPPEHFYDAEARKLGDQVGLFFESLNDHVLLRHPRQQKKSVEEPILTRLYATLIAVSTAAGLQKAGMSSFSPIAVSMCSAECLRAASDYGRLYNFRHLPALPEEKKYMQVRREKEQAFDNRMLALVHEDDEFADMGD